MKTKQCYFCTSGISEVDYKDTELIKRYLDQFARIQKSRFSGNCAKHQRKLAKAVKLSRFIALIPFVAS